ncbi:Ureidoglycolate lyase [Symmachiella dynata]|uniref:fumarylacetoacetate hydrolase family protein n=1 Tax=Symmachiella dynata TaxID=2527995 RepID=UPI0011897DA0|nr:fumarylacetoacetate hydrolase family protein [Symmachiella dynata]QDT50479.1 Ureidoglycolate lyase [Symmachiella dynata]
MHRRTSMFQLCQLTTMFVVFSLAFQGLSRAEDAPDTKKFARIKVGDKTTFAIVEGDQVREIKGNLFRKWEETDITHALSDVKILVPTSARHVFAMAGNYKSHLAGAEVPKKFQIPQPFFKSPSSLLPEGGVIRIPPGDENVHYEAELVVVIGKRAKNVPVEKAMDYVFGLTCGNDVSARTWQNDPETKDVQWWRGKGADTFGPCGPFIVQGLDPSNLKMTLRLNGEVRQEENTSQLLHDVPSTVSFISKHVTLLPGDLIFTGTPGKTDRMKSGDVVEVEIEGIGILRNTVAKKGERVKGAKGKKRKRKKD